MPESTRGRAVGADMTAIVTGRARPSGTGSATDPAAGGVGRPIYPSPVASRASRARGSVLPVVALVVIDVVVVLMLLGSTGAVDHATQGLDDSTRWSCAEHALADRSERRVGEMGEES